MKRFENKVVFITGASAGIGAALAEEFARQGANVSLAARRRDRLDEIVARIGADRAMAVQCDVCSRESLDDAVRRTVDAYGRLDVAVANAGFGVNGPFVDLTTDDYRRQFETNVFGVIDTAYAALPYLRESQGVLAFVSSVLGRMGSPATSAYCASKFAVCGLAESLYYELAELGVAVTCVNPGVVESDFRMTDNQGRFRDGRKDPAPSWLVVPTSNAAREIVSAIYKRKPEAVITGHGKIATTLARHFPRTMRFVIRRASRGRIERVARAKRSGGMD